MQTPLVYIDNQDIIKFAESGMAECDAFAYEWEGEAVIHIHLHPLPHSFGRKRKALFSRTNSQKKGYSYCVFCGKNEVKVCCNGQKISPVFIPAKSDLYSRNKGILEHNILEKKRVTIVGLGSFGSQIAIELAKAGVGQFTLFDYDRIELHNLARHTCGINDLGRLKTDAVYDAIIGKNPYASIERFPVNINDSIDLLNEVIKRSDIVICATDNNQSRYNINNALIAAAKVGIFGRAITRAEGGDVFRYRPGGPCYACLVGSNFLPSEEVSDIMSARRSGRIPAYMSPEEADSVVQVGLSSDINPICNLMIKLALSELAKGLPSGISSLEDDFIYDCYIWANRREKHYQNWHCFYQSGVDRTILRWYGVNVPQNDNCPICSNKGFLDADQQGAFHTKDEDFSGLVLDESL